jgi:putative phosphoesterase
MKLGLISDTHDYLDPRVAGLFSGVDHILHAGDVGLPVLLAELETIAPVTAVAGNTDDPALGYPLTQIVKLGGRKFLVHHIVEPHNLRDDLRETIRQEKPDVVMFGHTHKPFCQKVGGMLFFNPGYAGRTRFNLARSVAILRLSSGRIEHEFQAL